MTTFERIIPLLTYQDIPAAHDFLVRAFGFASGGIDRTPEDGLSTVKCAPGTRRFGYTA